jgi:putative ATP-dependent endonuclease of OLD family
VIISLFDFYVRNIAHSGSSLLAVEEPELYLHPHGRRVISDRLNRFVDKDKNQVIITTHSPEFISTTNELQNIISVRKNDVSTTAKNIYFNSPKRKQILIKKQNAEMFFADAVILSEGADKYFIEEASRLYGKSTDYVSVDGESINLGGSWINDYNVSIINCGGKHELWKYAEILQELEIPFFVTADFDFLRDGLNQFFTNLNYPQDFSDKLNSLKSKIATKITSGKYKQIHQLNEESLISEVKNYLTQLETINVFIFSGELENLYRISPSFDKEAGVIETMGKIIETSNELSEYVNCSEYFNVFELF